MSNIQFRFGQMPHKVCAICLLLYALILGHSFVLMSCKLIIFFGYSYTRIAGFLDYRIFGLQDFLTDLQTTDNRQLITDNYWNGMML